MQLMLWRFLKLPCRGLHRVTLAFTVAVSCTAWIAPAFSAEVSDLPVQLQKKVDAAAEACAAFENGEFYLDWGSVERADLDGDRYRDWVLNEQGFACSSAASLYCGTGGCMSHFLVNENLQSLLNQGWDVINLGPHRVLLADVHGSQCGGINPTPCVVASAWDAEKKKWQSASAQWE